MVAAWANRCCRSLQQTYHKWKLPEVVAKLSREIQTDDSQLYFLFMDEPASVGGLGSGLSPYELVSAGLAACTVMTMRLYAERKGFPLERGSATSLVHEKGCGHDAFR